MVGQKVLLCLKNENHVQVPQTAWQSLSQKRTRQCGLSVGKSGTLESTTTETKTQGLQSIVEEFQTIG